MSKNNKRLFLIDEYRNKRMNALNKSREFRAKQEQSKEPKDVFMMDHYFQKSAIYHQFIEELQGL